MTHPPGTSRNTVAQGLASGIAVAPPWTKASTIEKKKKNPLLADQLETFQDRDSGLGHQSKKGALCSTGENPN